ncbi:MAG: metalloendopeptidase [Candidatus Peregrinibacteria bacterium Greene0416_62]|nr:MAG: metalloendopeptidase [Candidatus Peregrinibacteria bacterium Greene0416_62]TSD00683.1 MAG: metalloendopeptidase [Candidatus Peregrinibacteria bacterium Greene1014_49]
MARGKRFTQAWIVAVAFASIAAIPVATQHLTGAADREMLEISLQDVLQNASQRYRISTGLRARQRNGEEVAEKSAAEIVRIGAERKNIRLEIAALREVVADAKSRYHIDLKDPAHAAASVEKERNALSAFVRYLSARGMFTGHQGSLRERMRRALVLGSPLQHRREGRSLLTARARLYAFFVNGQEVSEHLAALEEEHEALSQQYLKNVTIYERATMTARASEAEIAMNKRVMADVHSEVLRLQSELARIDARLQRKAERALIEKGLMDARPDAHADGKLPASTLGFLWPVIGRISAGFRAPNYEKYFGVPHLGMDIVVPMRTLVRAAADGIVFLVRDGGETGYSYILLGHRGGFATIYGHLSGFAVTAGEEVAAGQTIGFSGGEPGSYGAGQMTSGAHLHFEVIQNGVNVDPVGVLP